MQSFKYKGTPEQMAKVAEWLSSKNIKMYSHNEYNDAVLAYYDEEEGGPCWQYVIGVIYRPEEAMPPALELEIFGKTEKSLITEDNWKVNTGVAPEDVCGKIDVKYPDGDVDIGTTVSDYYWDLDGSSCQVTHWRFHKPEDSLYYVQPQSATPSVPEYYQQPATELYKLTETENPVKEKFLESAYDSPHAGAFQKEMADMISKVAEPPVDLRERRTEPRNKYMREIKPGVWVDVYDVIRAFTVTDGALQHLLKKALAVGQRGHKDAATDYKDILASAKRAVEMNEEWNND